MASIGTAHWRRDGSRGFRIGDGGRPAVRISLAEHDGASRGGHQQRGGAGTDQQPLARRRPCGERHLAVVRRVGFFGRNGNGSVGWCNRGRDLAPIGDFGHGAGRDCGVLFPLFRDVGFFPRPLELRVSRIGRDLSLDRNLGIEARRQRGDRDNFLRPHFMREEARRGLIGVGLDLHVLFAEQREPGADRLRALRRADGHSGVDGLKEALAETRPMTFGEGLTQFSMKALKDFGRLFAGYALIKHDRHRVDVRPGSLRIGFHILFDRCVGRRVEGDRRAGCLGCLETRGSEIDQDRSIVFGNENVGRLDVTVKDADPVRTIEARGNRLDDVPQTSFVEAPAFLEQFRQRHAIFEVHHHVSGAVNLEQAANADDVGMPGRRRQIPQQLGFLDELFQSQGMHFLDVRTDRDDRVFGVAFADRTGKIFFDCDEFAEIDSPPSVNNPKAADSEDVFKAPFPDHGSGRQGLVAIGFAQCRYPIKRSAVKEK